MSGRGKRNLPALLIAGVAWFWLLFKAISVILSCFILFEQKELATKTDSKELQLKSTEIKASISETKAELVRWVVGAGFLHKMRAELKVVASVRKESFLRWFAKRQYLF